MTDNVVELMVSKIKKLPFHTSEVLKLAACIGNRFELKTLSIIYQQSQSNTLAHLWTAIEEGLLLPQDKNDHYLENRKKETNDSYFKFQHDRVQQAAYSLINDADKQTIHLQIGQLLLANLSQEQLEENLFEIVNQLNEGHQLIKDSPLILKLAELNLQAGQKAQMSLAYQVGLKYLLIGIELLAKNGWQTQYHLTLALHDSAVKVAFLSGHIVQQEQLTKNVFTHARSYLDQVTVYKISIQAAITQNKQLEAVNKALTILKLLEVEFPSKPEPADIMRELQNTQLAWQGKTVDALYDLPTMTDINKLAIMQILTTIAAAAYQTAPELFPLMIFKQVQLSLQYGNTPDSIPGYAFYGVLLCNIEQDIETAYQFGQLALNLLEQFNAKPFKAVVTNIIETWLRHRKCHFRETIKPLQVGYHSGLETGDFVYAVYCAFEEGAHLYYSGRKLLVLEQKMKEYSLAFLQMKQENAWYYSEIYRQGVLNLMGTTKNPSCLMGEAYQEDKMCLVHQKGNDLVALYFLYVHKIILSYLFQEYEQTIEYTMIIAPYQAATAGLGADPIIYLYSSLARLAVYPHSTTEQQSLLLDKVRANQEHLQIWAHHAPMNHLHKFYLVEAEHARVLKQDGEAREYYDKAINLAQDNEFLNEEALAHELAGAFYLAKGHTKFAQVCLRDAHYAYQQWGAVAKVKNLEERYRQFLTSKTARTVPINTTISATRMASTSTTGNSEWLDLNSIMKAAQALSGEMVLSQLLEKMMHIVIENAGASIGFLLLPKQEQWFIEAEGRVDSNEVNVLQSHSIKHQTIAESIIHYVTRTHDNVVLNNATQEGNFTHDAHIVSQHPQSILCTPLINQGQLIGILYLENNLASGAFTPDRLEVIKILSSQLAISIENALLYQTLEQKVEERTVQLAEANEEITTLNEQLHSENLRMSTELDISRRLQQMLLPKDTELQQIESLDIAGFMEPADEVGGDYYDVLYQDKQVLIGIGDVTGHGLESGALAIMVQSAIRALLASYQKLEPVKFLSALNQMVYNNVIRMNTDKNLTLALLSYQNGQLVLTGQHEEMLVVRANGDIEHIDTMNLGFPLGLNDDITDWIHEHKITLNRGEVIVLYTDGITEAMNIDQEEYGLEHLCQVIQQHWQQTAHGIRKAVINDVHQFIGEQKIFDDITLLVLKQK